MNHALASVDDPVHQPVTLKKVQLIVVLLGAFASLAFAEKTADVSDDFIEYLGQMEDNDGNWSDFAGPTTQQDAAARHSEHSSMASKTSTHSNNDGKTTSGRSHP